MHGQILSRREAGSGAKLTIQELWERYHATGEKQLRDRLVLTLSPIVKYIVFRKVRELPPECELEDYISCGLEALMRAIDRYDPALGATLEQFAWTRIHGAVLDELRRNDWAPRSVRRWERQINASREQFVAEHHRPPNREELGELIGIEPAQVDRHVADINRAHVSSLNAPVAMDDDTALERLDTIAADHQRFDPEERAVADDLGERLRVAFGQLSTREQIVAIRLYVDNLTLREIGEIIGVTESRVCQIHSQLRRHLRELLTEQDGVAVP